MCRGNAAGVEPGLEARCSNDPPKFTDRSDRTWAVVEVDPETGHVDLKQYVALDDCGPQINPVMSKVRARGVACSGASVRRFGGGGVRRERPARDRMLADYALPVPTICATSRSSRP